ncbi:sensor histidine kinase [Tunturibacter empetritectus]|uniref:Nitrate/nitrite-specific signal transduction histidine kinase n=1 Tax=Tunturiibacter empetritectus TaxID=3069691 RepID=A0A7W8IH17_9BACT|nr:ATP-binding protein [Edaphobacter lichenicola]MBB5317064.1 nitrate/nitrite-specific signal transduction histidine kinase [Edaphobacter lichenicola]
MNQSIEQTTTGTATQAVSASDVTPFVNKMPADLPQRASGGVFRFVRRILDESIILPGFRTQGGTSLTIEQSLSGFLENFSPAGPRCQIWVTGKPQSLTPAILEQINLIAREALANAFLHSDATQIEAEVEYSTRGLRLIVRDNGRGMDRIVRQGKDSHWGLSGMRERAKSIGAQLRIWSRSGAGTEVEIYVPGHIVASACA